MTVVLFVVIALVPSAYILISQFSIESYGSILEPRQVNIFLRTVFLGLSVSFISLILGVSCAFLLECTDLPLKDWFGMLVIVPLLLPPYISTIAWMILLGKCGDWFVNTPIDINNIPSVVILMSLAFFPIIIYRAL